MERWLGTTTGSELAQELGIFYSASYWNLMMLTDILLLLMKCQCLLISRTPPVYKVVPKVYMKFSICATIFTWCVFYCTVHVVAVHQYETQVQFCSNNNVTKTPKVLLSVIV